MEHNRQILEKNKHWGNKVRIVGVSLDFGNPSKVADHCNAKGWTQIEHFVMPDRKIMNAWGIQGVPHVLLIDKEG